METIINGTRVHLLSRPNGFLIQSDLLNGANLSQKNFVDDLGNEWIYQGIFFESVRRSLWNWFCDNPVFADPIDYKKLRRRIEDRLRKLPESENRVLVELAKNLGVSI